MRRHSLCAICVLSLLALASATFAQKLSAESVRFHAYRVAMTEPSYGLAKVKRLIKGIKRDEEWSRPLAAKEFNRLTLEEKFTFTMLHGEDFSQNCSEGAPLKDERGKIFAYTADGFGEETVWSTRQTKFLETNRELVIKLLRQTMSRNKHIGANLKEAIVEIDAVELIPDLIAAYRADTRDNDILTVLLLLMKEGEYEPLMFTPIYMELYGDYSNYFASSPSTPATCKLILDMASAFARSSKN